MADKITIYNSGFYEGQREGSLSSARRVVPEILRLAPARSVVDVGCGMGTWLRVFQECGVTDITGVDGDYVDASALEFDARCFVPHDLQQPFRLDRQFDLVISLEVAEHIPPERAGDFVDSLVRLGSIIMFSAAIPFQNGNNHLNEQWPDYWVEQFRSRGYVPVDCIRRKVWNDPQVEPWYAQNTIVFVREERLAELPDLQQARAQTVEGGLSMVHPKLYFKVRYEAQLNALRSVNLTQIPLRRILADLPCRIYRAIVDRLEGRVVEPLPAQVLHPSAVPDSETRTARMPANPEAGKI